ncbi:YbaB/EbfC family nucleoid-associated protein [Robiginitalea sp. M366]|uniref:YbaB/EbfC family nucleoid-associated protein n=1 Tax=Robiginitalea aestuariiviva TaxID=3036903 RepID=UPI00240E8CD6|nr:YbaB/EbfC family nucleoid-associated protein [Robiginitalea aestuariiviva]MDG1573042.1 YbaB/EbfC family nucleoid-associated protein [Robiginitalea aestuariiviva]
MFGDMMGMMGKLKETRKKIEETKKRLDQVLVTESAGNGAVTVVITANREVREITLDDRLLKDREELTDTLILALNKAITRAGEVQEAELGAVAREGMPQIPGMDGLFK